MWYNFSTPQHSIIKFKSGRKSEKKTFLNFAQRFEYNLSSTCFLHNNGCAEFESAGCNSLFCVVHLQISKLQNRRTYQADSMKDHKDTPFNL